MKGEGKQGEGGGESRYMDSKQISTILILDPHYTPQPPNNSINSHRNRPQ